MLNYVVQKKIDGQWVEVVSTTSKFAADQEAEYWSQMVRLKVRVILEIEPPKKWITMRVTGEPGDRRVGGGY
jgi:hypothetical protein